MDTQDKFERYLLNRMDINEKAEFENELENNPLLKEQLELEQAIVTQIRNRAFVDKQISTAKKEMQKDKIIRLTLYSVVSLAAMLVLGFIVHGVWQGRQYDQLYASNFTVYNNDTPTNNDITRGQRDEIFFAVSKLQNGKTKLALQTLETLYEKTDNNTYYEQTRWYLALAHIKLHHKDEAKKYLYELVEIEGGEYLDKAKELLERLDNL